MHFFQIPNMKLMVERNGWFFIEKRDFLHWIMKVPGVINLTVLYEEKHNHHPSHMKESAVQRNNMRGH